MAFSGRTVSVSRVCLMSQHNRWINILTILTRQVNFLHYINSTYTTSSCLILTKCHITEAAEINTTNLDEYGQDFHTMHITLCVSFQITVFV